MGKGLDPPQTVPCPTESSPYLPEALSPQTCNQKLENRKNYLNLHTVHVAKKTRGSSFRHLRVFFFAGVWLVGS